MESSLGKKIALKEQKTSCIIGCYKWNQTLTASIDCVNWDVLCSLMSICYFFKVFILSKTELLYHSELSGRVPHKLSTGSWTVHRCLADPWLSTTDVLLTPGWPQEVSISVILSVQSVIPSFGDSCVCSPHLRLVCPFPLEISFWNIICFILMSYALIVLLVTSCGNRWEYRSTWLCLLLIVLQY